MIEEDISFVSIVDNPPSYDELTPTLQTSVIDPGVPSTSGTSCALSTPYSAAAQIGNETAFNQESCEIFTIPSSPTVYHVISAGTAPLSPASSFSQTSSSLSQPSLPSSTSSSEDSSFFSNYSYFPGKIIYKKKKHANPIFLRL